MSLLFYCNDFSHSHRGISPVSEPAHEVGNRLNGFTLLARLIF